MSAPEPAQIYERTRTEGRRRLRRPGLELAATALVGGLDVTLGVAVYGLAAGTIAARFGPDAGRLAGSLAFGIGFVFIVVGRSELFTENFLIPFAGLDRRSRGSWWKLGELWLVALVFNLLAGVGLTMILTTHGVLRGSAHAPLVSLANHIAGYGALTAFLSAVVAGTLMTLLTWLVEGAAESMMVRIVVAWMIGGVILIGGFDHSIVSTFELVMGSRFGAHVDTVDVLRNLGLAIAGNAAGGLGLVTFTRFTQAAASSD